MTGFLMNPRKKLLLFLLAAAACVVGGMQLGHVIKLRQVAPNANYKMADNSEYLRNSTAKIVVYTQANCAASPKVTAWLRQNKFEFEERVVERSNDNWNDIQAMKAKLVPVVLVGDYRIEGFNARTLSELLPPLRAESGL